MDEAPEFKFRKATNERAKLIGSASGKGRTVNFWIDLRGKESNKELDYVDS